MVNRTGYEPLSQSAEGDVTEGIPPPVTSPTTTGRLRRARPGQIDLSKLDNAFKR